MSPSVGSSTSPTDSGVTVAEIEMNRMPMIELDERLEERAPGGDVKDGQVGEGEAHEDRGDEPGVVADDVARCRHGDHRGDVPEVPRTSERLKCLSRSHSTAVPTTPPASPTATLARNCPAW